MVITEDQAMALFEQANPIPDVEDMDIVAIGPAGYLEKIEAKTSGKSPIAKLEEDQRVAKRERRRWVVRIAAAASLVAMLGLAWVIFTSQDNDVPPATTLPTTPEVVENFETFGGYWAGTGVRLHMEGNLYDLLDGAVVIDRGTYSLLPTSDQITFNSNSDSLNCSDATTGTYQYEFVDADQFRLTLQSDDCGFGRGLGQSVTMARTDPFVVPAPAPETTAPEATGPEIGQNGFVTFAGQEEPGRYETAESDYNFRTVIFESDGSWGCTTIPCSNGWFDKAVFEVKQREITAAFVVFSDPSRPAEEVLPGLQSNENVVVGDPQTVLPIDTDAGWRSAIQFILVPSDQAPRNVSICGSIVDLPCARTDLLDRRNTWNTQTGGGPVNQGVPSDWVVTSPQTIWLITLDTGNVVVASAYFSADYVPGADEVSALSEAAGNLIHTLVFP